MFYWQSKKEKQRRLIDKIYAIICKAYLLFLIVVIWALWIFVVINNPLGALSCLPIPIILSIIMVLSLFNLWGKFLKWVSKTNSPNVTTENKISAEQNVSMFEVQETSLRIDDDGLSLVHNNLKTTVRIADVSIVSLFTHKDNTNIYILYRNDDKGSEGRIMIPTRLSRELIDALEHYKIHFTVRDLSNDVQQFSGKVKSKIFQKQQPWFVSLFTALVLLIGLAGIVSYFMLPDFEQRMVFLIMGGFFFLGGLIAFLSTILTKEATAAIMPFPFGLIFIVMGIGFPFLIMNDLGLADIFELFVSSPWCIGFVIFELLGIFLLFVGVMNIITKNNKLQSRFDV